MADSPEVDPRVPTFVVIDEAHHLAPKDAGDALEEGVREQLREIATEGRKLGLFLILVSQRPDRLDRVVAGECSNVAVMRLANDQAIQQTRSIFGIDEEDAKELGSVRRFGTGRVLLLGHWGEPWPQVFYAAARRTVEGGRDLRSATWAAATRGRVPAPASRPTGEP